MNALTFWFYFVLFGAGCGIGLLIETIIMLIIKAVRNRPKRKMISSVGMTWDDFEKELSYKQITKGITAERLSEICAAEREGRCVILTQKDDMGSVSDGYHTFDELYDQRAVLFSVICRLFPDNSWKSRLHADGTMFDDCFIVGVTTPNGDYTYHYGPMKWDWFPIKEVTNAPEWDGHSDKDVIRLYSLLEKEQAESKLAEMKGGTEE